MTVGIETQRTWTLSKAPLAESCWLFYFLFSEDPTISEIHLPTVSPHAFADFVDYIRSSIYSVNTHIAGYRSIRAHTDACLLGIQLDADEYRRAATRALHGLFEPLARARKSNALRSLIRASDIEYICVRTSAAQLVFSSSIPDMWGLVKGLQMLFFDALAAHWTQQDVIAISMPGSTSGSSKDNLWDVTPWRDLYRRFPKFRAHLVKTGAVADKWRGIILKKVDRYYFIEGEHSDSDSECDFEIESADDDDEDTEGGIRIEQVKQYGKLTLKLRGFRTPEEATDPPNESMKPVMVEDIDAESSEADKVAIKADSDEEDISIVV